MKKRLLLAALLVIPMGAAFAKSEYVGITEDLNPEMDEMSLTPKVEGEATLGTQSATVKQPKSPVKQPKSPVKK